MSIYRRTLHHGPSHTLRAVLGVLIATLALAPIAVAQSTTGSISGMVVDQEGGALPGVTVSATHEPTGSNYTAITNESGNFRMLNVRVGGPYTVTAQLEGFRPQTANDRAVRLGQSLDLDFTLQLDSVDETVVVIADRPLINPERTGAASNVSTEQLETLPTVTRGLEDFARTNPLFNVSSENEDPEAISVAGRSSRYNNIVIDGSVNNDLFGLSDNGSPGGQAGTTPISLDAIAELQLVVSDFDVKNGGFSGGGINAITRSGSNDYKGSVFYYTRDKDFFGDGPEVLGEFGEFEEDQYGFRLGGPLVEDKAFFFLNADIEDRQTPTGWSIDGSSGRAFGLVDEANRFRDILINQYGFDPGGLGENVRPNPSDKYFVRADFNLSDSNQLTMRHNLVDAALDVNRPSQFTYEFPSEAYAFTSETNSTVLQLDTIFSSNAYNSARIAIQSIEDRRSPANGIDFPWVEIEDVDGDGPTDVEFEAGTEAFSTFNELDQDILEIHNDFTWLKGDHTITIGTHNEFFEFRNLFIQNGFGSYEFADLDAFEAGIARRYHYTFPNPGQDPNARFDISQYGVYFGDVWTVNDRLTLNFGLRVDVPYFEDDPGYNSDVEALYGFRTDEMPSGEQLIQPRFGFNWAANDTGTAQIRGGLGVFAGRTPYVWIANQYSRNSIVFTDIEATGAIPFNPDPFGQPTDIGGAGTQEVNLIDPNFNFPTQLRYSLAYDQVLPWWDLNFSTEVVYSDVQEDITYQDINLEQVGTTFYGAPEYAQISTTFNGAYLITNASDGHSLAYYVKLEKPARNGFSGFISYAGTEAEVVNEGSSSRAVSNFSFNEAFDPNNATASTSDFEVEHRFNASVSYKLNRDTDFPTTISLFYNLQSGRPFSWIMGSDFDGFGFGRSVNGDGSDGNDLLYVPAGPDDVIYTNTTWEEVDRFISSIPSLDGARGSVVGRNTGEAPWSHTLDLHLEQAFPVGLGSAAITFDILNLANLFDEDAGVLRYANFNAIEVFEVEGIDEATGRPIYSARIDLDGSDLWEVHNERSRWRAKLGVRWTF
ncbi:MAG: carboxypeptidase regulatory-like domain-containing protein [Thermoanaerobaculia bacterium]|nr:carboxypeptidase regulatory-like domain-containing protein [Thermoanaerobaculia bacterium]